MLLYTHTFFFSSYSWGSFGFLSSEDRLVGFYGISTFQKVMLSDYQESISGNIKF